MAASNIAYNISTCDMYRDCDNHDQNQMVEKLCRKMSEWVSEWESEGGGGRDWLLQIWIKSSHFLYSYLCNIKCYDRCAMGKVKAQIKEKKWKSEGRP